MNTKDYYKLEYTDVGHLRRHYSMVRSALSTFAITAALGALVGSLNQPSKAWHLVAVGIFMISLAVISCAVFSYRCERANLYAKALWAWFGAEDGKEPPPCFQDYKLKKGQWWTLLKEMLKDEMNWLMIICVVLITVGYRSAKSEGQQGADGNRPKTTQSPDKH